MDGIPDGTELGLLLVDGCPEGMKLGPSEGRLDGVELGTVLGTSEG